MKARCRSRRRSREIHVYRDGEMRRWIVASGRRAESRHRTQRTATAHGTRVANRRHVDLVVHGVSGRIRSKDSHGNETRRRDTEH